LVVLPFTNLSGDPEQEYFSDGITEDLTTELSRHPDLFVISRNSAFTYKGKPVKVEEVGRELGVRYVLEGAVRKAGDRIRVTAQLADATTGFHLWSERYDRELSDVFALQGEIAGDMQAALRVQIDAAEFERLRRHPPENLSAYDLHLKGRFSFNRFTRAGMAEARRFAEQAMALDPGFADNYAMLGGTYVAEYAWGWNLDPRVLERGEALARRALELNARSAWPYVLLANIQVFRGRPAEAAELAQRAIQLEPNRDLAHGVLAAALLQQRRLVGAMQAMQVALRLNPRHPSPVVTALGYLQLAAGRTAEAIRAWERVRSANPDMLLAQLPLAWQYEMQGRHDAARAIVQEIQRVNPQLTATAARQWIRPPIVDDSFVPALQRAGLP
jgi:adenylate cyclase